MSIPSRSERTGTFFVTSATFQRRRLFQVAANAELFLEILQEYRRAGHYKLYAFVIMPDHMHLLLTPLASRSNVLWGSSKEVFRIESARNSPFGNVGLRTIGSAIETTSR